MIKHPYNYDRKFTFKINDDLWFGYLLTEEECNELDVSLNETENGFRALTDPGTKCLFVCEGFASKGIIAHELFHIYVSYFYMDSADIDIVQFEELVAEFLEASLPKFIKKMNFLFNKYKKLEGSK